MPATLRDAVAARVPVLTALAGVTALAFVASVLVGPTGFGLPQGSDAASMIL